MQSKKRVEVLTMGVVLLPDSIHSPVRPYSQKEAPVFTIQPFGILEGPRRKAAAAAVFRCRGKCCDFSRGHLLLFSRFLATASSPSSVVPKPHRGLLPPTNCSLLPSSTELHRNWFYLTLEVRLLKTPLSGQQVPFVSCKFETEGLFDEPLLTANVEIYYL